MKAKVLETGEIVEVKQVGPGKAWFLTSNNDSYSIEELDFDVPIEQKQSEEPEFPGMIFKTLSSGPSPEEVLKAELAKKEIEKEMMIMSFKCQVVTIMISTHRILDKDMVLSTADYFSDHIFNRKEEK